MVFIITDMVWFVFLKVLMFRWFMIGYDYDYVGTCGGCKSAEVQSEEDDDDDVSGQKMKNYHCETNYKMAQIHLNKH